MLHWFAHLLGLDLGTVETYRRDGVCYVAHVCATCGKASHETVLRVQW